MYEETLTLRVGKEELAGELLTLSSGNDRKFEEYLSLMTVLCEISTSQSQENVHSNQSSVIESLPVSPIPVEDSELTQEEIDIFLVLDDLIPPGVENDDSEDEDHELPNLDHQNDPSIPRPPPEPPDVEKYFEPEAGVKTLFLTPASSRFISRWHFQWKFLVLSVALPKDELIQGSSRACDSVTKNKPLRGSSPHAYPFSFYFIK
ncbi:hypothetical protein Tco_1230753 [Tanacetum coccineum]